MLLETEANFSVPARVKQTFLYQVVLLETTANLCTCWRQANEFFVFLSLMSGPAGNSEFYFPSTSMFQNSLFPLGQVMKCSLTKSKKQNTQMHTHISRESVNRRKNVTVIVFNTYSPKWRWIVVDIRHTSWITSGPKSNFTCVRVTLFETGSHFVFLRLLEVNSTWLITSEQANQRARKALHLCGLGFCDIQNNQGRGRGYQPKPKAEADNNVHNIFNHCKLLCTVHGM